MLLSPIEVDCNVEVVEEVVVEVHGLNTHIKEERCLALYLTLLTEHLMLEVAVEVVALDIQQVMGDKEELLQKGLKGVVDQLQLQMELMVIQEHC